MTHLYLIRHGEAISAVKRTISNTRLSPFGIQQAERLRDRLAASGEIAADVLIASTMLRARHTAEIIAPALGLPIVFDEEVEEWRDGDADDMSFDAYQQNFKAVPFDQKPFFHLAPGAESWTQFMFRVCTALNRVIQEHAGKTIVIVCHGGVVDAAFFLFLGISTLQFPRAFFNTHNTSITHWHTVSSEEWIPLPQAWLLERYNDVMHLRDLNTPARIPWEGLAPYPAQGADESEAPTEAQ